MVAENVQYAKPLLVSFVTGRKKLTMVTFQLMVLYIFNTLNMCQMGARQFVCLQCQNTTSHFRVDEVITNLFQKCKNHVLFHTHSYVYTKGRQCCSQCLIFYLFLSSNTTNLNEWVITKLLQNVEGMNQYLNQVCLSREIGIHQSTFFPLLI